MPNSYRVNQLSFLTTDYTDKKHYIGVIGEIRGSYFLVR